MSSSIYITDDGDEVCYVRVNEEIIAEIDHGLYGWAGMEGVLALVERLAEAFNIPIYNEQDIV